MCTIKKKPSHPLLKTHPSPVYNALLANAMINKDIVVLQDHCIVMRRDHQSMKGKVKIIGGGGAGTEPGESYFVGKGMLTAAVVGDVFTAPSAHEILVAIRELAEESSDGILLLVKNYIGDRLNFSLAVEKALSEDITVKMLVIGEDISHSDARKQGLAGSVLVYKIAGEMAELGRTLEEIIEECINSVLPNLATVNITMSPCSNTVCDPLMKFIEPNEMVMGTGIYGKGGAKKMPITDLKNAVSVIVQEINSHFQTDSGVLPSESVVLINNLGGISKLEEANIAGEVINQLNDLGLKIVQYYVGTFMSSLETHGFSVSVLQIIIPEILIYLSAATSVPSWPKPCNNVPLDKIASSPITVPPKQPHDQLNRVQLQKMSFGPMLSEKASAALKQIAIFAAEALISCEKQLNIIDAEAGDGDAGSMLKKGAEALREAVTNNAMDMACPGKFLYELSEICCKHMGGLTGALYKLFFSSASQVFQNAVEITPELCCEAFRSAVEAMQIYGNCELGDRTILDVLCPAADSFECAIANGKDLSQAVYLAATTCEFKAEETKQLKPVFLQILNLNHPLLYADAGAHAATIWLRAVSEAFESEIPTEKPGIFLWKVFTEEESKYVLEKRATLLDVISLIERKIGTDQNLLLMLLLEIIKFSRKNFIKKPKKVSALLGMFFYTHQYFTASGWRTPSDVYFYFKESILRHSVESPPVSMEIFTPDEAKKILLFFFENYMRNLPLVSIMHLPHYKLHLALEKSSFVKERLSSFTKFDRKK